MRGARAGGSQGIRTGSPKFYARSVYAMQYTVLVQYTVRVDLKPKHAAALSRDGGLYDIILYMYITLQYIICGI